MLVAQEQPAPRPVIAVQRRWMMLVLVAVAALAGVTAQGVVAVMAPARWCVERGGSWRKWW